MHYATKFIQDLRKIRKINSASVTYDLKGIKNPSKYWNQITGLAEELDIEFLSKNGNLKIPQRVSLDYNKIKNIFLSYTEDDGKNVTISLYHNRTVEIDVGVTSNRVKELLKRRRFKIIEKSWV